MGSTRHRPPHPCTRPAGPSGAPVTAVEPTCPPSLAATPGLCLCRDSPGATPPLHVWHPSPPRPGLLRPELLAPAAEQHLGLRRLEGQLKAVVGAAEPDGAQAPTAASGAVLRAGTVTAGDLWACGLPGTRRCALWDREPLGREGRHVGLELPRPGQPWLRPVSSWPSGRVTKPLGMSAFSPCDTGFDADPTPLHSQLLHLWIYPFLVILRSTDTF